MLITIQKLMSIGHFKEGNNVKTLFFDSDLSECTIESFLREQKFCRMREERKYILRDIGKNALMTHFSIYGIILVLHIQPGNNNSGAFFPSLGSYHCKRSGYDLVSLFAVNSSRATSHS